MAYEKEINLFLNKMKISKEDFEKSGVEWKTLKAIKKAFKDNEKQYEKIAFTYVEELSGFENVHTVRYRIKDVDHLLEKIIRKTLEGENDITVDNFAEKITDIIGVRVLYVFKSDWKRLHEEIKKRYADKFSQNPEIKLKDGDSEELYKGIRNVEIKKGIYRSIHYTLRHTSYDENSGSEICKVKVEIQTRSIFEEGWSEINHKLIYKKDLSEDIRDKMMGISNILCVLSGECDQLGELLRTYKIEESSQERDDLKKKSISATEMVDIMEGCLDIPVQRKKGKQSNKRETQ